VAQPAEKPSNNDVLEQLAQARAVIQVWSEPYVLASELGFADQPIVWAQRRSDGLGDASWIECQRLSFRGQTFPIRLGINITDADPQLGRLAGLSDGRYELNPAEALELWKRFMAANSDFVEFAAVIVQHSEKQIVGFLQDAAVLAHAHSSLLDPLLILATLLARHVESFSASHQIGRAHV